MSKRGGKKRRKIVYLEDVEGTEEGREERDARAGFMSSVGGELTGLSPLREWRGAEAVGSLRGWRAPEGSTRSSETRPTGG